MERAAPANSPGVSGLRSPHKPTCMERVPRRYRQVVRSRHQERDPLSVHFLPREELFYREASDFNIDEDDPVSWLSNFGCAVPELQALSIRTLSQSEFASPCETNWSLYDWIVNKKRDILTVDKQRELIFLNASLRLINTIHIKE